jgi:hypothetical protein
MKKNGTLHFRISRRANMDKFYIDYRIGKIVKNLDISFMAPELYIEVVVDDAQAGIYRYKYANMEGKQLDYNFTELDIQQSSQSNPFQWGLDTHCVRHNFTPDVLVSKVLFLSQAEFDTNHKE